MVCGLFSSFDPMIMVSGGFKEMKWFFVLFCLFVSGWQMFTTNSGISLFFKMMIEFLFVSLMRIFINPMQSFFMLFSLFFFIFSMNLSGLIPMMFSPTSHLVVNLSLSIPLWMGGILYGVFKSYRSVLAHLVPTGSPSSLWLFLVIVESISLLIRPITLSVRLMANVMAGHLIMSLIGDGGVASVFSILPSSVVETLILGFEMCVSLVQSYVFMSLLSLYWVDSEH